MKNSPAIDNKMQSNSSLINVVLVEPKIPQNTGNIARLTAGTDSRLHLIEPLGFELSDSQVKRAGLDYWEHVDLRAHRSWEDFLEAENPANLWFFTTKASRDFTEVSYQTEDYLVFGSETKGLSEFFHKTYPDRGLRIPINNQKIRSFNLANSVAIGLFEVKRQLG